MFCPLLELKSSHGMKLNFSLVTFAGRLTHIHNAGTMDVQCVNALPSVERGIVRDSTFILTFILDSGMLLNLFEPTSNYSH